MYRVLYRKWRPKTFDEVYGQTHITKTLSNEVKDSRLAHAYLFTGSRGTGKTSCAKILAKAVNCLNPQNGNPCNECEICKGIDSGSILDVVEIDAASNRGIDDIRALREESAFTPAQTKYRVYIIDEVHMLTLEAFNALLKTLEEPPEHIIFILATTEVHKLPSTILSRCQRFDFGRISVDAIVSRLQFVAENENVTLSDEGAHLISRIADGGMRDALSLLDRCIAISENVDEKVVSDAAGLMNRQYLFDMSKAFAENDTSKALSLLDELHNSSCDSERLCSELCDHFRNLLIIKSVKKPGDILVCTNEELEELKKLAERFSVEQILNIMDVLSSAIASIKTTQNRRAETETAIIRICSPEASTDISSLLSRIAQLEKRVKELSEGHTAKRDEKPADDDRQDIFASLEFEDDSDEYDDEPQFDEPSVKPVFDEPVSQGENMPFGEEPIFDEEPVFDDAPVFDDEPVFDSEPEPEKKSPDTTDRLWVSCIAEIEKNCPPAIGHLLGTKASVTGDMLTITNYNSVLPMIFPMVKDKITETVRKIMGQKLNIRLG